MERQNRNGEYFEIDRAASQRGHDELMHRVTEVRNQLHKDGFTIHDVRVSRKEEPYFMHKGYRSHSYDAYISNTIRYTAEFDMAVSLGQAEDFLSIAKKYEYLSDRVQQVERNNDILSKEVAVNRTTRHDLKKVLTENPGIADQWDEMLTLLKLAGFDGVLT